MRFSVGCWKVPHVDVESSLDGGDRAADLDVHAVAAAANDGEAVKFGEVDDGIILRLRWSEPLGEFGDSEEVPIGGAGGVVEILEKVIETCGIAQRQDNVEIHDLVGGESADGLGSPATYHFAHVVGQH